MKKLRYKIHFDSLISENDKQIILKDLREKNEHGWWHQSTLLVSKNIFSFPHVEIDTPYPCLQTLQPSYDFQIFAGPCAIRSEQHIHTMAQEIAHLGLRGLRGGAYKPRTSPYTFQGVGGIGYQWLGEAARSNHLFSIAEVVDEQSLDESVPWIDILQIGARNMDNYHLLQKVGRTGKATLLKRAPYATYHEWLLAAEYLAYYGCSEIFLCERGLRTFEPQVRFQLDIAAPSIIKQQCSLPIFIDPSHPAGNANLVPPLTLAAVAAGADGLLIECDTDPKRAQCDTEQQLSLDTLAQLIQKIDPIHTICHAIEC